MMLRWNPASYLLLACALGFRTSPEISPQEIYNKAVEHLRDGDFENSAKLLDRARNPRSAAGYSGWFWRFRALRAEVFMEQNRSNDALALLNTNAPAEEENPEFAITRRILQAKYEMRQSRFSDAFANCRRLSILRTGATWENCARKRICSSDRFSRGRERWIRPRKHSARQGSKPRIGRIPIAKRRLLLVSDCY